MHVFLLAAITADGFIGRSRDERSFDWTSPEDKQFYVQQIKTADAIVMGRTSFESFTRYPKNSRWILYTSKPENFKNPKPETIHAEGTNEAPGKLIERLRAEGCQRVAICGGASIYTQFMQAGAVDTLYLTVESLVFGSGVKLFSEPLQQQLELRDVHRLSDQTVVLEYGVKRLDGRFLA